MRNLKKITISLLIVATLITAFSFTAKADEGELIGVFLKNRSGITVENEEAEELFLDFLEKISFIVTDESWTNILEIKGRMGMDEKTYNAVMKGDNKIPYEELSDFDLFVYNYTYLTFVSAKNGSAEYWETHTANREALAFFYQDYLNFKPTEGNNREVVNTAFEKIWDWQYEYIQEHGEPFDFVSQLTYSEMFPNSESESGDTENLSLQDQKEIESALEELDKNDREELQQAAKEVTAENSSQSDKSSMGIVLPVVIILAAVILVAAFIFMKKSNSQKK